MKRSDDDDAQKKLEAAESGLRRLLLERLPEVAESGYPLFEVEELAPAVRSGKRDDVVEFLFQSAVFCTMMRELLYLQVEGSVGALFVAACVEHCSSNEQRRGPRKLAAGLLEELQRAA